MKTSILEESVNTNHDEKITPMERQSYVLDRRRLGSEICEFCDKEFKSGCEKDRFLHFIMQSVMIWL